MKKGFSIWAAIVSSWLIYLADLAVDMKDLFGPGFWQDLAKVEEWKLYLAAFALLLFPFLAKGSILLGLGLKRKWLGNLLAATFASLCVFLHSSYIFFGKTGGAYQEARGETRQVLGQLLAEFTAFKNSLAVPYFLSILVLSLLIFWIVVKGKSIYPPYMAWINPLTGLAIRGVMRLVIPELNHLLYPFVIPAFWVALMMTVYLLKLPTLAPAQEVSS